MAALGFSFKQPMLLSQALAHSSFAHENPQFPAQNNERLEFLGDAVLDLVVSEWLFGCCPELDEGAMTRARAMVVCETSLAAASLQIDLGRYLLLGCGERTSGANPRPSILADAFEAVVGAIYLDGGLVRAKAFVESVLAENLVQAREGLLISDHKSKLQEELQKDGARSIVYELVAESGPAHAREFVVQVVVDGCVLGNGSGRTKKQAEQDAAKSALQAGCP